MASAMVIEKADRVVGKVSEARLRVGPGKVYISVKQDHTLVAIPCIELTLTLDTVWSSSETLPLTTGDYFSSDVLEKPTVAANQPLPVYDYRGAASSSWDQRTACYQIPYSLKRALFSFWRKPTHDQRLYDSFNFCKYLCIALTHVVIPRPTDVTPVTAARHSIVQIECAVTGDCHWSWKLGPDLYLYKLALDPLYTISCWNTIEKLHPFRKRTITVYEPSNIDRKSVV